MDVTAQLTSHDATIHNFAIAVKKFRHIIGPSIRRKFYDDDNHENKS